MTLHDTALSRRDLCRMLGIGGAAAIAPTVAFGPDTAQARRVWCRADPLFLVGTKVIDVTVGSQFEMLSTATGPVKIKLITPVGVPVTHLLSDFGFGQGYSISYATDASLTNSRNNPQVRVEVMAPSAADLPVSVYFTRLNALGAIELRSVETQGRSNVWISAR